MALSNADKDWIQITLKPLINDMANVKDHLGKINGKILKHEEQITQALVEREGNRKEQQHNFDKVKELDVRMNLVEKDDVLHYSKCPVSPRLREIEDKLLTQTSVHKVMGIMFTGGIALGGLIVAIIKLWQ